MPRASRLRDRWIVTATTIGLASIGAAVLTLAISAQQHAPLPPASAAGRVDAPVSSTPPPADVVPASTPTRIDIPAIGLRSSLVRLGRKSDGAVAVPSSYQQAGWYDGSVTPGQAGPAVILGHLDSYKGPGVFYQLGDLRPGDTVSVHRSDRRIATFTLTAVRTFPKDRFPTAAVYGGTGQATIRLITCGGAFNTTTKHYLSNIIAFGTLTRVSFAA